MLLGKFARSPADSLVRRTIFIDDSWHPQLGRYALCAQRGPTMWASQVMRAGADATACDALLRAQAQGADVEEAAEKAASGFQSLKRLEEATEWQTLTDSDWGQGCTRSST